MIINYAVRSPCLAVALLVAGSLSSCDALLAKEIARLPVSISTPERDGLKEVTLQLQQGDEVAVWSDMDMSYQGDVPLQFQMQVLQNGQPFQQLAFDPREKNISIKEVRTEINGSVNWSFSGKNGELRIPASGAYTFQARMLAPASGVLLRKAEVVLRK
jgi:hypothetical protein